MNDRDALAMIEDAATEARREPKRLLLDDYAMVAMRSALDSFGRCPDLGWPEPAALAARCFQYADAMLRERDRGRG